MTDVAAPLAGAATHALGRTDYETTWRAMQSFTSTRTPETRDEIWLTEHPPVYTLGLAGRREHLLRDNGIPALKVDRGGQITYHGPGQLVAYLLFDLKRRGMGIRAMVRSIEASIVEWLDSIGISAYGKPAAPGVYVMVAGTEAKIAALGLEGEQGLHVPWLGAQCRNGLGPVRRYRSVRLQRARRDAARRPRRRANRRRSGRGTRSGHRRALRMSRYIAADRAGFQRRRCQAQGCVENVARICQIRDQSGRVRAAEEARLDSGARAVVAALLRNQENPAPAQPSHRVRGSVVSRTSASASARVRRRS